MKDGFYKKACEKLEIYFYNHAIMIRLKSIIEGKDALAFYRLSNISYNLLSTDDSDSTILSFYEEPSRFRLAESDHVPGIIDYNGDKFYLANSGSRVHRICAKHCQNLQSRE